jgi:tetratricopeptide (TPR) repeat protein
MGTCYEQKLETEKAILLFKKSITICEEEGNCEGKIGDVSANIGLCLQSLGHYDEAIGFSEKFRDVCEKLGDTPGVRMAWGAIGRSYSALGQYEKAVSCHRKQWEIARELGVYAGIGQQDAAIDLGETLWALHLLRSSEAGAAASDAASSDPSDSEPRSTACPSLVEEAEIILRDVLSLISHEHRHKMTLVHSVRLSALLHLSSIVFYAGKEEAALDFLKQLLSEFINISRVLCLGCAQQRGETAKLLMCSGCGVARSRLCLWLWLLFYSNSRNHSANSSSSRACTPT